MRRTFHYVGRGARALGIVLIVTFSAALFYLLVIMGDYPDAGGSGALPTATAQVQALQALPVSPMKFTAQDLFQATQYFNGRVMALSREAGWILQGVEVTDGPVDGVSGTVRQVRLSYLSINGDALDAISQTPETALRALPGRGFVTDQDQNFTMLGTSAVLMTKGATLSLHVQSGAFLYRLEGDVTAAVLRGAAGAAGWVE